MDRQTTGSACMIQSSKLLRPSNINTIAAATPEAPDAILSRVVINSLKSELMTITYPGTIFAWSTLRAFLSEVTLQGFFE